MSAWLVGAVICAVIAGSSLRRAFRAMEDRYMIIFAAFAIFATVFFMVWVVTDTPFAASLNYAERQAPYYQDAINGTSSAMLAYCDNAPRYFGDCLASLELEATVTAQARGE